MKWNTMWSFISRSLLLHNKCSGLSYILTDRIMEDSKRPKNTIWHLLWSTTCCNLFYWYLHLKSLTRGDEWKFRFDFQESSPLKRLMPAFDTPWTLPITFRTSRPSPTRKSSNQAKKPPSSTHSSPQTHSLEGPSDWQSTWLTGTLIPASPCIVCKKIELK